MFGLLERRRTGSAWLSFFNARPVRRTATRCSAATSSSTSSACRSGNRSAAGADGLAARRSSAARCCTCSRAASCWRPGRLAIVVAALPPGAGGPAAPRPARGAHLRADGVGHLARRCPKRCSRRPNVIFGASYTDVHASLPFLRISIAVLAAGAGLAVWHGFGGRGLGDSRRRRSVLAVSVIGGLYAGFVQSFVVTRTSRRRSRPYIRYNIDGDAAAPTRSTAWRNARSRATPTLTPQRHRRNAATIQNVRLWDHEPLLQTFSQIQEIRTYYDFVSVDNDRYMINGQDRQVMLSVRELNTELLPNRQLGERAPDVHPRLRPHARPGQPGHDRGPAGALRPESAAAGRRASTSRSPSPSIYFGELSNDYVLVRTSTPEFHYPAATTT